MNDLVIKNIIKQHLKIKVEQENPHTLTDGYIRVGIYWDNELINESTQKVTQSFF